MNHGPTLEDVAHLAGVSTATVSRALNTPDRVRHGTRLRVEEAVNELGYTPHFGGRALASNRTFTIGAIIPTMENAIFARGIQALQEDLAEADYTLLVATSNYDPRREADQIRTLLGRGIDGLVLIGEERDPSIYSLLQDRGTPFVLVWTWRPDCPWTCVGFDNRAAARAVTERVLDYGHKRIAMIAGVTDGNDRAAARVVGFRQALTSAGITLGPSQLIEAEYTVEAGADAAMELLSLSPRPTAIVCGNDVLAAGAIKAVRRSGLNVPGDVSVTGFDNIELADLLEPSLTTVHVPHRRMGRVAARLLLQHRDRTSRTESVAFETEIIERHSLSFAAT